MVDWQSSAFPLDYAGNTVCIFEPLQSCHVAAVVAKQTGARLIIEFLVDLFDIDTTQLGAKSPELGIKTGYMFKVFSRSTLALHTIND